MDISCGLKGFTQVRPLICQEVRLGVITVLFSRSAGGYCNSDRDILRVQTEPMSPISTCPTRHHPRVWVIRLCPIIASRQPHIVKPKKALMVVSDKLLKWHIFFFARFVSYLNNSDFSSLHNLEIQNCNKTRTGNHPICNNWGDGACLLFCLNPLSATARSYRLTTICIGG